MHRLFVGLSIPEIVTDSLSTLQYGVDGARWRPVENFHVTLAFIGETDRHGFAEAAQSLSGINVDAFELTLLGVGFFGGKQPRSIWAGVAQSDALALLQSKVEQALRCSGFNSKRENFNRMSHWRI